MPNSTAATRLPTRAPAPTLSPVSSAKAAPVKDNSLEPCTANDICRITMNGPIKPGDQRQQRTCDDRLLDEPAAQQIRGDVKGEDVVQQLVERCHS